MLVASPDSFRALARSSPWRWSTLRFTVRWSGDRWRTETLRAWERRPDLLRVETAEGNLVQIVREQPQQVGVLTRGGGRTVALPWAADGPPPERRPDGLVASRPSRSDVSLDDPMYQDYFWVAMLDPVELADGLDGERALVLDAVTEVEHAGRPAWEAAVRTTPSYEPRCADENCALLRSRDVDVREAGGGGFAEVLTEYPEAYRVRLDVQTGVCVLTEAIGGLTPGSGHDLRIEAVDEPMDDGLFVEPRRRGLLGRGWQPFRQ